MLGKSIVCLLLIASAAQALRASNLQSYRREIACVGKKAWYRELINDSKKLYDHFKGKLVALKLQTELVHQLNAEQSKFENAIAELSKKLDADFNKLGSISDSAEKESVCQKNIDTYANTTSDLSELALNLKTNVLKLLEASIEPEQVRFTFDIYLSRIVNLLFLANSSENQWKNATDLLVKALRMSDSETALEKMQKPKQDESHPNYEDLLSTDDSQLQKELDELQDDSEIKAAEERIKSQEAQDDAGIGLDLGLGIASLALILLAILVGSVLVWLRSRSYFRFSNIIP